MSEIKQEAKQTELQERLKKLLVPETLSIKQALRKMDEGGEKILFLVDDFQKLRGTLTDGDIRRWLIHEGSLEEPLFKVARKNPKTLTQQDGIEKVRDLMIEAKVEVLPVIDRDGRLLDAYFWNDIFGASRHISQIKIEAPVFIMAGGKGARLDPFTKILPKPLIPLGEKPIVEVIMDHFATYGCRSFYLTVNYKGKMIQSYFESAESDYDVHFIWEEEPLGTAGGLIHAKGLESPSLFVTNCDVVIKADYADIWQYHHQTEADITVVGSMRHFSVPYGVLETRNGGCLERIVEKPEYDFLANTGLYVIRKEVLRHIPENRSFDFPELMEAVKSNGGKVQVYPISQKSWLDAGEWQEYRDTLKELQL